MAAYWENLVHDAPALMAEFKKLKGACSQHVHHLLLVPLHGPRGKRLLTVIGATVKGVVYGMIGTALAQGLLGGTGFWIAGVPSPYCWTA